jgi:hypothetical protein
MSAPKRRNNPVCRVKCIFCQPFKDIHRTIQECISRGLEFARSYKGKFLSFSSSLEASKDREFVTPFHNSSVNRGRNRPVVVRHSITSPAGYSADVATLAASSCLCAQTGDTFRRKVASAGKHVDGHQKVRYGPRCPSARKQPRRPGRPGRGCQSPTRRGMQTGQPGCGGCRRESRNETESHDREQEV